MMQCARFDPEKNKMEGTHLKNGFRYILHRKEGKEDSIRLRYRGVDRVWLIHPAPLLSPALWDKRGVGATNKIQQRQETEN